MRTFKVSRQVYWHLKIRNIKSHQTCDNATSYGSQLKLLYLLPIRNLNCWWQYNNENICKSQNREKNAEIDILFQLFPTHPNGNLFFVIVISKLLFTGIVFIQMKRPHGNLFTRTQKIVIVCAKIIMRGSGMFLMSEFDSC